MMLQKRNHPSLIQSVFKSNNLEEKLLNVSPASGGPHTISSQSLLVLSPFFRGLLSSVPCCTEPQLILPEVSSASLDQFVSMLSGGTTDILSTTEEATEVIEIAKMFDIDAANYSVVNKEMTVKQEPLENDIMDSHDNIEEEEKDKVKYATNKKMKNCQICSKQVENNRLMSHYTNHLKSEIVSTFGDLMDLDSFSCKVCGKRFRRRSPLLEHMGMVHKKVNSILIEKGLEPVKTRRSDDIDQIDVSEPVLKDNLEVSLGFNLNTGFGNLCSEEPNEEIVKHPEEKFLEEQEIAEELVINEELVESSAQERNHLDANDDDGPIILTCSPDLGEKSGENDENDDPLNDETDENKDINSEINSKTDENCQICFKEVAKRRILQHYTGHCMQEIKERFGHLLDFIKVECNLCETKMKKKSSLIVHMGMVHMKVNEILVEKGLVPVQKDVRFMKSSGEKEPNMEEHVTYEITNPKQEPYNEEQNDAPIETMEVVNPILCQICRNLSLDIDDLWKHYKTMHYSKTAVEDHTTISSGLACKKCRRSFDDENTLFMHIGICYDFLEHKDMNNAREKGSTEEDNPGLNEADNADEEDGNIEDIDAKNEPNEEDEGNAANETMEVVEPILCQICRNLSLDIGDLWKHYKASHFSKPAVADHTTISTGLGCNKCRKSFDDENTLFMHIGVCQNFL